jgi:large subunit ribosomal protein L15
MKAPFSPSITKNPQNSVWAVNTDPQRLNNALNNLLGKGGEHLLPDELKWLAVTHKSFDQGRRGFNDRLAFLGRQIAVVESMQSILTTPTDVLKSTQGAVEVQEDAFVGRREPFADKALEAADRLSIMQPEKVFDPKKLHKLAVDTGLSEVVRWKPRLVSRMLDLPRRMLKSSR